MSEHIRSAGFADLDAHVLYDLLALRAAVFVVEQACVYLDPDGRDTEPTTVHWWTELDGCCIATLRVLREPHEWRIGRVATAADRRSQGVAARLLHAAVSTLDGTIVLDAQAHLVAWYRTFGFEVDGDPFVEDGIPHQPMRRTL